MAATSRPELIDPALLRPGRLDKAVHCGLPSRNDRVAILATLCAKIDVAADVCLDDIADMCKSCASSKSPLNGVCLRCRKEQRCFMIIWAIVRWDVVHRE